MQLAGRYIYTYLVLDDGVIMCKSSCFLKNKQKNILNTYY